MDKEKVKVKSKQQHVGIVFNWIDYRLWGFLIVQLIFKVCFEVTLAFFKCLVFSMDETMDEWRNEWMDEWMVEWIDGMMDGMMDGTI